MGHCDRSHVEGSLAILNPVTGGFWKAVRQSQTLFMWHPEGN